MAAVKRVSLPFFEQAKPLFEKESKASLLVPYWGMEMNEYHIAECNKPDEEPAKAAKPVKEKKKKEK